MVSNVLIKSSGASRSRTRISKEIELIITALHAQNGDDFKSATDCLLTEQERAVIAAAEASELFVQAAHIYDTVVRRVTLRFAELINFAPTALVDVLEPRDVITSTLTCVALSINSRDLKGSVAFKISELSARTDRFPQASLSFLGETAKYWNRVVYLEPLFNRKGETLRTIQDVRRLVTKSKDPILCGYIGCGPIGYGYNLPYSFLKSHAKMKSKDECTRDVGFLLAHWD